MSVVGLWYRASGIRRFHTLPMLFQDSVGQHSGGVAFLVMYLMEGVFPKEEIYRYMCAALVHDLAEFKTGDIPSPTKNALGRADLSVMERTYVVESDPAGALRHAFSDAEIGDGFLSLADALDGLVRCALEMRAGNACFRAAFHNYRTYVTERTRQLGEKYPLCAGRATRVVEYANSIYSGGAL